MKQMGKQEINSFTEFGPQYFDYLTDTLMQTDQPKVIINLYLLVDINSHFLFI